MPLKNFHSCRIDNPGTFAKGSFRTLKAKTKGLSLIIAVKKSSNKSMVQSYRYDKAVWDIDKARNHCATNDGLFEGARTRKELALDDNGKDYLKVLDAMNQHIAEASIFYTDPSASASQSLHKDLNLDLNKKVNALKSVK